MVSHHISEAITHDAHHTCIYLRLNGQIGFQLACVWIGSFVVQTSAQTFDKWCVSDARADNNKLDAPNVVVVFVAQGACVAHYGVFGGIVNRLREDAIVANGRWDVADDTATAAILFAHVFAGNFGAVDETELQTNINNVDLDGYLTATKLNVYNLMRVLTTLTANVRSKFCSSKIPALLTRISM